MEVIARSKFVRLSPRKLRLVAEAIRGLKVIEAQSILDNLNNAGAKPISLTLKQAIGNAVNNFKLKKDGLKIKSLEIGQGPSYKRMDKSHRVFRWGTIQKKTAHIRMVLEGEKEEEKNPLVPKLTKGRKKINSKNK